MKNIILIIALTLSIVFSAEAQMHVNTNTGAITYYGSGGFSTNIYVESTPLGTTLPASIANLNNMFLWLSAYNTSVNFIDDLSSFARAATANGMTNLVMYINPICTNYMAGPVTITATVSCKIYTNAPSGGLVVSPFIISSNVVFTMGATMTNVVPIRVPFFIPQPIATNTYMLLAVLLNTTAGATGTNIWFAPWRWRNQ